MHLCFQKNDEEESKTLQSIYLNNRTVQQCALNMLSLSTYFAAILGYPRANAICVI